MSAPPPPATIVYGRASVITQMPQLPPPYMDTSSSSSTDDVSWSSIVLIIIIIASALCYFGINLSPPPPPLEALHHTNSVADDDDDVVRRQDSSSQPQFHVAPAPASNLLDSLPLFTFRSVTGKLTGGGDCAVCLSKFEPHDQLRLLPRVPRRLHQCVDCIQSNLPALHSALIASDYELLHKILLNQNRSINSGDGNGNSATKYLQVTVESGASDGNFNNRTSVRIVQQAAIGISQICFSTEERISPKKPTTVPEVAKQRELSGTIESDSESRIRKHLSNAKSKELSGTDIFGPPSEAPARSSARASGIKGNNDMGEPAPRALRTSVKLSNVSVPSLASSLQHTNIPSSKSSYLPKNLTSLRTCSLQEGGVPPGSAEKPLSVAKLKEMNGNDIFSDGKAESGNHLVVTHVVASVVVLDLELWLLWDDVDDPCTLKPIRLLYFISLSSEKFVDYA
ncbi:hypothetical protein SASPL_141237 [Salvia splendens]|uniref:DUF4057 domain-containing protein n=1 Tax=Salvia splendens TaxID=180675 RepID=A0A8X8WS46_SALSN|nr:hypothetical protein SASPL_141237 [Salvia splendens]